MRVFVHPEADMSYYTNVGVLPFKSLSTDRFAGEKFSVEFTTALLSTQKFTVLDQGIFVNAVAKAIGVTSAPNGLDRDQLKRIAEATGVQGVFMGTVSQYEMVPTTNGNYPVISVEARLLDAGTGTVVWKATATERGGPKTPVIGIGELHTLGELAQKIGQKLVNCVD